MEHVRARQHGGATDMDNLAWACQRCNAQKGPNLTSVDPDSSAVVPLFHPRRDTWQEHFSMDGLRVVGLTPTGRATVWPLQMNSEKRLKVRTALREYGLL